MSANTDDTGDTDDASGDSGPGTREVAYRLFATEFDDATLSYSESDEERAPNYVVTPTGLRVNRLFAVGVLTEVERLNTDTLRGRIVDPTGAFVTYAGQYQPEAQAFLDSASAPSFVSITGKARTFEPDDADQIFTSVRPESLSEVTADTRDRWTVSAAEATLDRVAVFAAALESERTGDELRAALADAGVDTSLAAGIPRAIDHYGTTTAYLEAIRQCAVDALEVVADERDEVRPVDVAPGSGGEATLGSLPAVDIDLSGVASESAPTPEAADTPTAEASSAATDSASESTDSSAHTTNATAESSDSTVTADAEADSAGADTPASSTTTETPDESTPDTATESTAADPSTSTETAESTESDTARSAAADTTAEPSASSESEQPDDAADDPEMYQLDDERAEELESEFGADFSSGNEVDPAGEADIDVPDADELAAEAEAADEPTADQSTPTASTDDTDTLGSFEDTVERDDSDDDSDDTTADVAASTDDPTESDGSAADSDAAVDIEDAAVDLMSELDDGDGADREAVVAAVVDEHGVDIGAVEDAIDDALMGGRCYEPDDGTLKPI